jgi:hypothetical protein
MDWIGSWAWELEAARPLLHFGFRPWPPLKPLQSLAYILWSHGLPLRCRPVGIVATENLQS